MWLDNEHDRSETTHNGQASSYIPGYKSTQAWRSETKHEEYHKAVLPRYRKLLAQVYIPHNQGGGAWPLGTR